MYTYKYYSTQHNYPYHNIIEYKTILCCFSMIYRTKHMLLSVNITFKWYKTKQITMF